MDVSILGMFLWITHILISPLLCIEMFAISDEELAAKLQAKRDADAAKVLEKNAAVEAEFAAFGKI